MGMTSKRGAKDEGMQFPYYQDLLSLVQDRLDLLTNEQQRLHWTRLGS